MGLVSGRSPWGASRTTSSWFGPFWDSTSASSVGRGEEAVGSEALFTSDESKELLVESSEPWADCMTKFGVRKCQITEKRHKLFGYPDAYDFARGLTLDGHSSPPSSASEV